MTGEGNKRKKDRDPIFSACFVVFIVACVGVLGTYVDEHYLDSDDTVAAYGDTVEVNYTGSYYAYYDQDGAVIFDTSLSSVDGNDDYVKANEYSSGSSGSIDVTIGDGDYLIMFENCLVGHRAGDEIRIEIPLGDGYVAPAGSEYESSTRLSVPLEQTMTKAQFDDLYDIDLEGGVSQTITSAYGWPATAYYDVTSNTVTITNMATVGQSYEYVGNEDSSFGQISFSVDSVDSDGNLVVDLVITDYVEVDGGIQMVSMNVDGTQVYITDYDADAGTYTYKTCGENYNIVLYFVIEIVSVE